MDLPTIQLQLHPEDDVLAAVRARVGQAVAVPDVGVGALLAHTAGRHGVRNALLLGSGGGVTGAWLLDGMVDRGIITCIEPDGRRNALVADAAHELGTADRMRLINAPARDAAPRLRDGNYDMVVVQVASPALELVEIAARLLRVGGVLAVRHADTADEAVVGALATGPWADLVVLDTDGGVILALRDHDTDA